jgi:hypothetical protein
MLNGKPRKMKAWLVTWEWCGEHAKRDDKIAAIFNPRLRGVRVRELVEFLYANEYTLSERMDFARGKPNPYPAKFGTLDGVPWEGEILCGHNPFLRARLVEGLTVQRDANGKETAGWKERPKPDVSGTREGRV